MRNIYDLTIKELEDYFISINEKKFRAVQVYEALYKRRIKSFDDMTNISKEVREKLKQDFSFYKIKMLIKQQGKNVNKYLFELEDGNKIESVLMFHDYGTSICVSSQVGCNMTCAFCESGRLKKVRNLLAYEIVQQILQIEEDINKRITHVVLMGIGEPFDNYDNVLRFVKIINCGKGIDIGSRHITISTCGVIPGIKKFMNEEGQVKLAICLHAPNDTLRSRIMPINKAYPLNELMETIKEYINKKIDPKRAKRLLSIVDSASKQSSEMERIAQEAERETNDLKKAEYLLDKVGNEYDAVISSVTSFGMFIALPSTVEGLVLNTKMNDDYYSFVESQLALVVERTH